MNLVPDPPAWASEVRVLRARLHLTQADMGRELGVSRRTIQRWEDGTQAIHPTWLRLLQDLVLARRVA